MLQEVVFGLNDEGDLFVQADYDAHDKYELELLDNIGSALATATGEGSETVVLYGNPPPGIYAIRVKVNKDDEWTEIPPLHLY